MKTHRCCHDGASRHELRAPSPMKRIGNALEWIVPGAIAVAMPKCPACVAAYIALATGVGISLTAAAYLRTTALALCMIMFALVIVRRAPKLLSRVRRPASTQRSANRVA